VSTPKTAKIGIVDWDKEIELTVLQERITYNNGSQKGHRAAKTW
jgi:hypothetical protein